MFFGKYHNDDKSLSSASGGVPSGVWGRNPSAVKMMLNESVRSLEYMSHKNRRREGFEPSNLWN